MIILVENGTKVLLAIEEAEQARLHIFLYSSQNQSMISIPGKGFTKIDWIAGEYLFLIKLVDCRAIKLC